MRLLDLLIGRLFRKDSRGRLTLTPFGPRGTSYIVPPDRAEAYARFMLRFYVCLVVAIALGGVMFGSHAGVWTPGRFEDLETASLRWLASADDPRAWAALPSPVRDLLDQSDQLPSQGWHQMFGTGVDIQGAVEEHAADHLLLQCRERNTPPRPK